MADDPKIILPEHEDALKEFAVVMKYCDEEMLDGIFFACPMTHALYERTTARLEELGAKSTLKKFRENFREFGI